MIIAVGAIAKELINDHSSRGKSQGSDVMIVAVGVIANELM